jgi:hypothetical protein
MDYGTLGRLVNRIRPLYRLTDGHSLWLESEEASERW